MGKNKTLKYKKTKTKASEQQKPTNTTVNGLERMKRTSEIEVQNCYRKREL